MLIIGAKGFAIEVLEILHQLNSVDHVCFFDNISEGIPDQVFNKFQILRSFNDAKKYFNNYSPEFTLGIGDPKIRYKMYLKMKSLGGELSSTISPFANIGHYETSIGSGCNIMTGVIITNQVTIGSGVLLNLNSTVGHNSQIDNFVEISPGVNISGNCKIGQFSNLGTNSVVLPKIKIGHNVIVGAGAVVTKDVESNSLVVGIPAKKIKDLPPLII